jgi:hypothetical protein
MAYDEGLAQRVREEMEELPGFDEKKMFGGICFLIHGNMACGVLNDEIIVRVGADRYQGSLEMPHTREFDITGRPMKGWVVVSSDDLESDEGLGQWLNKGIDFARSLPPK